MDYSKIVRIHRALCEAKRSAALAQALVEQAREAAFAADNYIRIADALIGEVRPG